MSDDGWLSARFAAVRPQALAALNQVFRNLDLAEEALATACERALATWPRSGEPADPLAWLLTTARNAGIDILRREQRRNRLLPMAVDNHDALHGEDQRIAQLDEAGLHDDVLRLMFVCCHPALPPQDQSALALRVVAGLSTEEIAKAFVVRPGAMEKRLVRAKAQIREAGVTFDTPDAAARQERLRAVSLMIYLTFNEGWSATSGAVQVRSKLCEEAIRLARLLLRLFSASAELQGLLALCLFHYARRDGRVGADGRLLTLEEQDRSLWDHEMIREASSLLAKALRHGAAGAFQIQAAIAAAHATAETAGATDWPEIERLYGLLAILEATPVVQLNHAAAIARVQGPEKGLAALQPLAPALVNYRWFHTTRAQFLFELGRTRDARDAFEAALRLGPTDAERQILAEKIARCEKSMSSESGRR